MDNQKLPNIIFIMADDMGYGDVGCYNPDSKIPTPNIDQLAQEGIRCTDAHSPSAVCTPTRYGVLTGRYCWRSRLKRGVLYGYEPPLIEPDRLTVAGLLRDVGYNTACVGKWHLGLGFSTKAGYDFDFNAPLPWSNAGRELEENIDFSAPLTGGPIDLGFDYFYGNSGCPTCQPPYGFIEDDRFVKIPNHYHEVPEFTSRPGMMTEDWEHKDADPIIAEKAVAYIERQTESEDPFFLYLTPSAPHEPCTEEVVPEFASGQSDAGPRGDLVWLVDWMVGEVMKALDKADKTENTLIFVTSDNGALPGDRIQGDNSPMPYHLYNHKSCGDWRGYKAHIWEGGHREPLVARWPGVIKANTETDGLICLTDLMATCAAIVGTDVPNNAGQDSFNILPNLLGKQPDESIRQSIVHHSSNGVFSIRHNAWKLILETEGSGGWPPPRGEGPKPGTPGQLYHIFDDPGETDNLWEKHPSRVEELTSLLRKFEQQGHSRL